MTRLCIKLFGSFEAQVNGAPLPRLRSRKGYWLLALLALRRGEALEVARELADTFPDGICLVELASLAEPALVPQAVVAALGLQEESRRSLLQTLKESLRHRQLLLVLDNCEHLLTACAHLVEALLQVCPALRILPTSREGLGVPGEQLYRIPSLSLPPLREGSELKIDGPARNGLSLLSTLLQSEAVQLFKVRMDGVTFVLVGRGFGENVDGNWGYVYVSDKATDEQVKALQGMMEGQIQSFGPKAPHLAGKFLGMRKVPMTYEVSSDRRLYSVVIPGILEFRTRSIILPGRTKPVMSTGIFDEFGDRFVHSEALVHKYNDPQSGHSFDLTGRQSNQADFRLNDRIVAKGGIGWGCWSAHASLGAKDKYQEQDIGHEVK